MDTSAMKFMIGTEGNPDYLIVAENGNVGLGVKPIVGMLQASETGANLMIGFRVRSALFKDFTVHYNADEIFFTTAQEAYSKSWPNIHFTKVDDRRASYEGGQVTSFAIGKAWDGFCADKSVLDQAISTLIGRIPAELVTVEYEHFREWAMENFEPIFKNIDAKLLEIKTMIENKKKALAEGKTLMEASSDASPTPANEEDQTGKSIVTSLTSKLEEKVKAKGLIVHDGGKIDPKKLN